MHHPRHERNPNSKFSKSTQTVLFNFTVNGANLENIVINQLMSNKIWSYYFMIKDPEILR